MHNMDIWTCTIWTCSKQNRTHHMHSQYAYICMQKKKIEHIICILGMPTYINIGIERERIPPHTAKFWKAQGLTPTLYYTTTQATFREYAPPRQAVRAVPLPSRQKQKGAGAGSSLSPCSAVAYDKTYLTGEKKEPPAPGSPCGAVALYRKIPSRTAWCIRLP